MRKTALALLCAGLVLAACSGAQEPAQRATVTSTAAVTETQEMRSTSTEPVVVPTDTQPAVQPAQATPRPGMSATSPGMVNLSEGGPKLVEFFAFW